MATKEKKPHVERREHDRVLRCDLTEEEISKAADTLAQKIDEYARAERELDSVKSQFKSRMQGIEADLMHQKDLVRDKYEMRGVKCEEIKDFDTQTVRVIRKDKMEIIEERTMRDHELQMSLKLEEEGE